MVGPDGAFGPVAGVGLHAGGDHEGAEVEAVGGVEVDHFALVFVGAAEAEEEVGGGGVVVELAVGAVGGVDEGVLLERERVEEAELVELGDVVELAGGGDVDAEDDGVVLVPEGGGHDVQVGEVDACVPVDVVVMAGDEP